MAQDINDLQESQPKQDIIKDFLLSRGWILSETTSHSKWSNYGLHYSRMEALVVELQFVLKESKKDPSLDKHVLTYYRSPPRTIQELAKEVIAIQDACNPLGVSKEYARIVQELRERLELLGCSNDTIVMKRHPICQTIACKVADLHDLDAMTCIRTDTCVDNIAKMTDDEYKSWHNAFTSNGFTV